MEPKRDSRMHGANWLVCAEGDESHFDKDKTPEASVTQQTARMRNECLAEIFIAQFQLLPAKGKKNPEIPSRFPEFEIDRLFN
jgi:hypothetical protein